MLKMTWNYKLRLLAFCLYFYIVVFCSYLILFILHALAFIFCSVYFCSFLFDFFQINIASIWKLGTFLTLGVTPNALCQGLTVVDILISVSLILVDR